MNTQHFTCQRADDITVATTSAALETCEWNSVLLAELREELALIAADAPGDVVLDIRRVSGLDHGSVDLIAKAAGLLNSSNRKLAVCCSNACGQIFEICRLEMLFHWYFDLETAMASLNGVESHFPRTSPTSLPEKP